MNWSELISTAINTATAGTDVDNNPIIKQRLEAAAMTDQALQALAVEAAGNPEIRARLERRSTITITAGVGPIPAGMLIEYLREGSVRDEDQSQFQTGNPYSRIKNEADFFGDTNTLLARYCLINNSIYACQPGTTDYTQFSGNLIADAPFAPTTADLSTTVPDELVNDLVEILARRLRGMIAPSVAPV